jgi:nicotinate-nucleotide pyrophosphorylase (carboxylating)
VTLRELVAAALDEDVGAGDVTTEATVPADAMGRGAVVAKQDLVVCGHEAAAAVFAEVDRRQGGTVRYVQRAAEGSSVRAGTTVAEVDGPLRNLLVGERLALNFLMKLCGIATHTRRYVDAAGEGGPRVVDTRKTTPLLRDLEKGAVRAGGGHNHRHALYDGVLVKDNHVAAVGSLTEAVRRARAAAHHLLRVEVEVGTLEQLAEALASGADAILLDNMDDTLLAEAVRRARAAKPGVILEASGNMTPERIAAIRGFGLDLVSAGGLVHHAPWADLSLKLQPRG